MMKVVVTVMYVVQVVGMLTVAGLIQMVAVDAGMMVIVVDVEPMML